MRKFKIHKKEDIEENYPIEVTLENRIKKYRSKGCVVPSLGMLKTPEQICGIRESGKVNTAVLDAVAERISPGMSTEDIDKIVFSKTMELGGIPAQLGYEGFPKSVCTSVNDQVCHGIPSEDVILKAGDIVNVDASTLYNGYYSDSSRMFCIGDPGEEASKLLSVLDECVGLGIKCVKPWGFLGDIGHAISGHAKRNGCSVVREIGGHGIGLEFHEEPWVGYVTKSGTGMLLVPGFVFTIEPMINYGREKIVADGENGWTIYTEDGSLSAQSEVTVLVTENGYEILAH